MAPTSTSFSWWSVNGLLPKNLAAYSSSSSPSASCTPASQPRLPTLPSRSPTSSRWPWQSWRWWSAKCCRSQASKTKILSHAQISTQATWATMTVFLCMKRIPLIILLVKQPTRQTADLIKKQREIHNQTYWSDFLMSNHSKAQTESRTVLPNVFSTL